MPSLNSLRSLSKIRLRKPLLIPPGQQAFTTPGTYTWTAPAGVTRVSVVAVGGGGGGLASDSNGSTYVGRGGGAGGGLGWKNNIPVVPGQSYTVVVGSGGASQTFVSSTISTQSPSGTSSYFIDLTTVAGLGGEGSKAQSSDGFAAHGGSFVGDGGGNGGNQGQRAILDRGAAGGAGGYTGAGGMGSAFGFAVSDPTPAGGGGGGSASPSNAVGAPSISAGGVGILGQGASGAGGATSSNGSGGSGGSNGQGANGGNYGGGSGGLNSNDLGGSGAVRIIWGTGRAFPATDTADIVA
jgi:hypothetical protein